MRFVRFLYKAHISRVSINTHTLTMKHLDHQVFTSLTNPLGLYLLGLLWADGNIHRVPTHNQVSLATSGDDVHHFYPLLLRTGEWSRHQFKSMVRRSKPGYTLYISNKEIKQFMMRYGYREKSKRSPIDLIKATPLELKRWWLLGFLDGDGCISVHEYSYVISFSGAHDTDWTAIKELIEGWGINTIIRRYHTKNGSYSQLVVSGKEEFEKLGGILYQDQASIPLGLDRKYRKYLDGLEVLKTRVRKNIRRLKGGSWQAYVHVNIEGHHHQKGLGTYPTAEEATQAVVAYRASCSTAEM